MKTLSEQIREITNKLDEIEFESIEKPKKPAREHEPYSGMTTKPKYGTFVPSHEADIYAMDFLELMDKWKDRIDKLDDVHDERLKHDLQIWLEKFKNKIQQL